MPVGKDKSRSQRVGKVASIHAMDDEDPQSPRYPHSSRSHPFRTSGLDFAAQHARVRRWLAGPVAEELGPGIARPPLTTYGDYSLRGRRLQGRWCYRLVLWSLERLALRCDHSGLGLQSLGFLWELWFDNLPTGRDIWERNHLLMHAREWRSLKVQKVFDAGWSSRGENVCLGRVGVIVQIWMLDMQLLRKL